MKIINLGFVTKLAKDIYDCVFDAVYKNIM